jgi:hypothetical protein
MSTPLEIKPETADMLAAQAKALGLSVDEYLRGLLARTSPRSLEKPLYETATPNDLARAYAEWAASHDPNTPVVLDDSREVIYGDDGR